MPVGFTVLKCEEEQGRFGYLGYIVDFLCLPKKLDVGSQLILAALDYFRERSMDISVCYLFEHSPFYPLFIKLGFSKRRESLPFIVYLNIPQFPRREVFDTKRWHIVAGDTDLY
jgi:hypothetical protein